MGSASQDAGAGRGGERTEIEDGEVLVEARAALGGGDDDEALGVRPLEYHLAWRAADPLCDCSEHGVEGPAGIPRDRAFLPQAWGVNNTGGLKRSGGTYERLLYASMTMPCLAENSSTSFHDA